jgi:hypothetical protein
MGYAALGPPALAKVSNGISLGLGVMMTEIPISLAWKSKTPGWGEVA